MSEADGFKVAMDFLLDHVPLEKMSHMIQPEVSIDGSRGRARRTPPLRVQILSFRHTKFSKCNCLGSRRPPLRGRRTPTGNPGSATGKYHYSRNLTLFNNYLSQQL